METITSRNLYATATSAFAMGLLASWGIFYNWTCLGPLKPFDAPAWIQAVGSLIAIGIAIAVPAWTAASARADRRAKEVAQVKRAEAILHPALRELSRRLGNFIEANHGESDDPQLNFHAVDGDFETVTPRIMQILAENQEIGEIGPDVYSLVVQLNSYEAWIKALQDVMDIGYNNHFLRTEMPDRLMRARAMREAADNLIDRIEADESGRLAAMFGAEYCRD